jgi:hypothetical protein
MRLRLVVTALLTAALVFSQANTGSISGTVADPNGASVPGAKVRAKQIETGQELETVTTEAGLYVFPSLPVGNYTVTVEANGFKKAQFEQAEIRVAQRQTIDFKLEIGDVQQTVEVEAQAQLLETDNAERGQNFSNRFMNTLPLFTGGIRNPEAFVSYMPGVNAGSGETSITGSGGRAKEVLLDGASQTIPESGGVVFNFPASEQFGEFKLVTSNYSAEYGRFGGGLEIFITRSGGNDVHGGAFLNMRRDIWNAAGYNSNRVLGREPGFRAKERFNEVGGVIGGPIWIPKVYDGRNKTFWFFTIVKDLRPASISQSTATVPTALMKQGNFSEVSQLIYDPLTTQGTGASATRTPFAGNIIPQSRWSRVARAILPLIPDPNSPGLVNNYQFINQRVIEDTHWSLKFDHSFTPNNRISYYQSRQNQDIGDTNVFPGPLGQGLGSQTQKPENYRVNHDLVISPAMLLHSTFGFTRQQQGWDNPEQRGFGSRIGLPLEGLSDAFPRVQFTGADALTPWGIQDGKVSNGTQFNWTFHFTQALNYVRGKHEFKVGWDLRRLRTFSDPVDLAGTNGLYSFARAQTALPTNLAGTGNAFASMLLGAVDNGSTTVTPVLVGQIRYGYHAVFFQDNWKVTPRLTLNLGFRYDVPIGWHEKNGDMSWVDLTIPNPSAGGLPGVLLFAGDGPGRTGTKRPYPTDWSNIGPRLGFAWRATEKTVFRGGWGIYYQTLGNGGCGCREGFSGGSISIPSDGLNQAFNWDNGGVPVPANTARPPFIDPTFGNQVNGVFTLKAVDAIRENFGKAPRIYNWSFGIQHELAGFLFDAAYVANRAHRLASTVELNQLPTSRLGLGSLLQQRIDSPAVIAAGFRKPFPNFPDSQTLAQALRPYPQFGAISDRNAGVGRSWYDSLQTKVERRFGLWQLMGAYTWSKSLGLMHFRQIFSQTQVNAQDAYNIPEGKSYLPFDQPHVLNILNSFDLPFGRGRKWLNGSRWVDAVVGGWTIAGAQRYYSGNLIQVTAPNTLGNGVLFSRIKKANLTGSPILSGTSRTSLDPDDASVRYFNAATPPFSFPGQYELGTAAFYYDDFRQPPIFVENVSVQKRWKFPVAGDRTVDLVYRADAFNLFNRTNFGVNGTIGNANFGRATGPQQGPRAITMGLRLDF